jgi:hypothetical protein
MSYIWHVLAVAAEVAVVVAGGMEEAVTEEATGMRHADASMTTTTNGAAAAAIAGPHAAAMETATVDEVHQLRQPTRTTPVDKDYARLCRH